MREEETGENIGGISRLEGEDRVCDSEPRSAAQMSGEKEGIERETDTEKESCGRD
jgi:hypothetical protein